MAGEKLTTAQRGFLGQLTTWARSGFARCDMRGSEWRMADRLKEAGYVTLVFRLGHGDSYVITPAGRRALEDSSHE